VLTDRRSDRLTRRAAARRAVTDRRRLHARPAVHAADRRWR
jgi:hypothetical protein